MQCGIVMSNLSMIKGVSTVALAEFSDEYGAVLHMLRNDDPHFFQFGECYFSEVLPGAIKAWKLHNDQTQNIAVPVGRIKMVIYDSRLESPTKGYIEILELGRPDVYLRVQIPPGLWYGFTCISNTPALLVNCADMPHDPNESMRKPISDSSIPYDWLMESK